MAFAIVQLRKTRQVEQGIHQGRKSLKRTRALIRLVRQPLGEETYASANATLRDAARQVSGLRDLAAMQTTLDELQLRFPRKSLARSVEVARKEIATWQTDARAQMRGQNRQRQAALEMLEKGLDLIPAWVETQGDFAWLRPGVQKIYAQGKQGLADSLDHPDTHTLHDWRKRVKYLWHQLQLLNNCWPQLLAPLAEECHRLSDLLGDDHDLAVIEDAIREGRLLQGRVPGKAELVHALAASRDKLRHKYFPLGKKIFSSSPDSFADELAIYWTSWEEEFA